MPSRKKAAPKKKAGKPALKKAAKKATKKLALPARKPAASSAPAPARPVATTPAAAARPARCLDRQFPAPARRCRPALEPRPGRDCSAGGRAAQGGYPQAFCPDTVARGDRGGRSAQARQPAALAGGRSMVCRGDQRYGQRCLHHQRRPRRHLPALASSPPFPPPPLLQAEAAAGFDHLAGDPVRLFGGEKGDHIRNILRFADSTENGLGRDLLG